MRHVGVIGVAALLLVGFVVPVTTTQANVRAAPPPAFVVVAAKRMAVALGDAAPSAAQYVLTRHGAAEHASSGGTGIENQPVYLIVLTGHFRTGPVGPAPGTIARGRFATEILDARNGRDTDFGIGPQPIAIRSLGLVGNLLPYMQRKAVPACSAPDLRTSAALQGATGSQLGGISVINESTLSCVLPATPDVSLSWQRHTLAVRTTAFPDGWLSRMNPRWNRRVTIVPPRGRAQVIVQWFNWCGATPWGANNGFHLTVSVAVPRQAAPVKATTGELVQAPVCNQKPKSGTGSTIRVSPFVLPS